MIKTMICYLYWPNITVSDVLKIKDRLKNVLW